MNTFASPLGQSIHVWFAADKRARFVVASGSREPLISTRRLLTHFIAPGLVLHARVSYTIIPVRDQASHRSRYTSRSAPLATSLRHASDKSVIKGFALIRESPCFAGGRWTLERKGFRIARERETEKIKGKETERRPVNCKTWRRLHAIPVWLVIINCHRRANVINTVRDRSSWFRLDISPVQREAGSRKKICEYAQWAPAQSIIYIRR